MLRPHIFLNNFRMHKYQKPPHTMNDIRKFIDIVSESPAQVRAEIDKKIQKISDEGDLSDILKFTNRYGIKKDVEKFTNLRQYKDMVAGVFLQALADANVSDDKVKKFLIQLSGEGILNEKLLLTPRKVHNYIDLIDPAYRDTFDAIKLDLSQKISGKIGEMGDVGKGEYMLDIISPHVKRRGAPGDLDISGTKIELKAGESGRLGPAGSQALVGRFAREYVPIIQKIQPNVQIPTDSKNISDIFNPKIKMRRFSEFFGNDSKKIKLALKAMLKMHYGTSVGDTITDAVVGSGGAINGDLLKREMLKASFNAYKEQKQFDGVIIMDSAVTGFLYVRSGDDMAAVADQLVVKFPSWTDTQSNSMKLTLSGTALKGAVSVTAPAIDAGSIKPKSQEADQATTQVENFIDNLAAKYNITDENLKEQMVFSALAMYHDNMPAKKIVAELQRQFPELANKPATQTSTAAEPAATVAPVAQAPATTMPASRDKRPGALKFPEPGPAPVASRQKR